MDFLILIYLHNYHGWFQSVNSHVDPFIKYLWESAAWRRVLPNDNNTKHSSSTILQHLTEALNTVHKNIYVKHTLHNHLCHKTRRETCTEILTVQFGILCCVFCMFLDKDTIVVIFLRTCPQYILNQAIKMELTFSFHSTVSKKNCINCLQTLLNL